MSDHRDVERDDELEGLLADDLPHGVLSRCEGAFDDLRPSERERLRHITSTDYYDPWEGSSWWSPFYGGR